MAWHPSGDECKVKVTGDKYGFGPAKVGKEVGILVELPEKLFWFGKHSLVVEESFMAEEKLGKLLSHYQKHLNKPVAWESLQDRGRHFKEGDSEYVYLKLSDIIAVADRIEDLETTEMTDDARASGGSFSL